jgi:hypothetical protein
MLGSVQERRKFSKSSETTPFMEQLEKLNPEIILMRPVTASRVQVAK